MYVCIKGMPECSPVGESQANGTIELAVQSVAGQIRVVKDALEKRFSILAFDTGGEG